RRWRSRSWPIRPCAGFRATFPPPPAPLAPWCSATSRRAVEEMKLSAVGRVAALAGVLASCAPLPPAGNVPAPPAPSSQAGPGPGSDAREPRRSGSETGLEPLVRWNGKTWRGRFKIFIGPRGKLTLAVRVPLETYLVGVVPGEIGSLSDELVQAGRAQAIAAR